MTTNGYRSHDTASDIVVVGNFIHSTGAVDLHVLEEVAVGVRGGKIVFIVKQSDLECTLEEFSMSKNSCLFLEKHKFVIPGFVDTHSHAAQFSFMGTGSDLQLLPWLAKYTYPTEARIMSDRKFACDVYRKCVERTLRCGTTTNCYYATIDRKSTLELVDIIDELGQRAYVGKVNMDTNSPDFYIEDTDSSVQETRKFIEDVRSRENSLITPCITPRFAITCTSELMSQLGALAKEFSVPVQTHISENNDEIKFVLELFPDCQSYAEVYDKAGLLTEKTVLAHGVHLTDSELKLLKARGSGVSHCANSNFCLCSGYLDVRRCLKAGVKVGLGTDFAGGNNPSLLDAIRRGVEAATVCSINSGGNDQDRLTYREMFFLSTLGSCQVMGLDDKIGNFEVGKEFDALVVDPQSQNSPIDVFPEDESLLEVFQKFLFQGDDRNIARIYVQGKHIQLP